MLAERRVLSAALACLLLASVSARELKVLTIDCCENGFSLDSDAVSVQVQDDIVQVDAPFVSTTTTPSGTVVDTPVVWVDTRREVVVKVASGEVLHFTRQEDGRVKVLVGKDGELVTVLVEEEEGGSVEEKDVVVDFSKVEGVVVVEVGEGGKIVDAKVDGDGKGKVEVGKDGKIAVVDLKGDAVDVVVGKDDEEKEDDLKVEVSGDEGSTHVHVKGTDIVDASVKDM